MADDGIVIEGIVKEIHKGDLFTVSIGEDKDIIAKPAGRMRFNKIKILIGDKVSVKLSVYNLNLGSIIYRHK